MSVGVDIVTVQKIGSSLFAAYKAATSLPERVDRRDGLYELHEILSDWTRLASNSVVKLKSAAGPSSFASADWNGPGVLDDVSAEISEIWTPPPSIFTRWQTSARRKAARRGLRTVLAVHAPDLVSEFDEVTAARLRTMETYSETLMHQDPSSMDPADRARMVDEIESTALALAELTEHLRELIVQHYRFSDNENV